MATQKGSVHSVGNLNSKDIRTIPEVVANGDIENYTLGELSFVGGVRKVTPLSDATKEGVLVCAVEVLYDNEQLKEFYVGTGEYTRVIKLEDGVRFDTSAYSLDAGITAPAVGQVAEFDTASEKFVLKTALNTATPTANAFEVVDVNSGEYGFGLPTVRLEVIR